MSSSSSPSLSLASSHNPVGLWFCQISSGLQGSWWHSDSGVSGPQSGGANNGARGADARQRPTAAAATDAAAAAKDVVVVPLLPRRRTTTTPATCRREAMPEATVYLLLDRFAPS